MNSSVSFDVAVVGCGPVGAYAAIALARYGLRTVVIEAAESPHPQPRAVHFDHEIMRLLQDIGVVDFVKSDVRETDGHLHVGADGGMIRYLSSVGRPRRFGWANDYFFYQPEFEAHLRTVLRTKPEATLRLGTTLESLAQDDHGVTLTVASRQGRETLRARWLIGCDGARSTVRRQLGVTLEDLDFEEPWLVVDAEVDAPLHFPSIGGMPAAADLQRLSVMFCDPKRPLTVVPGRGRHRRWEFMLLPGESDEIMAQPEQIERLIHPWVAGLPYRVVRAATYRFHGLVAKQWHRGRVFLAGDAAHQTPPFFGQGMCHGFRDAANLAWKLALVAKQRAGEALLGTYQTERDPQVRAVIAAAISAGRYICLLDPEAAATRDATMRQQLAQDQGKTAADLITPIAGGVIASASSGAGERFVQPWLNTSAGRSLMDEVTGGGWRLLVRDGHSTERVRTTAKTLVPELALTVVDASSFDDDGIVNDWFVRHRVCAVVLRPDFYVFGSCETEDGIEPLLHSLRSLLCLNPSHSGVQP